MTEKLSKSQAGKLGKEASLIVKKEIKEKQIADYAINPSKCNTCDGTIEYEKRQNKFCSKSCAATKNNKIPKRAKNEISYKCAGCSAEFLAHPKFKRIFCSLACQATFKKNKSNLEVEEGKGTHRTIKRYLIEKYGNIFLGDKCAWDFSKQTINVELEHIDGNSSNNSLENCTLLCPNCHSMTSTYKIKNRGNGRHNRRVRYAEGKSY